MTNNPSKNNNNNNNNCNNKHKKISENGNIIDSLNFLTINTSVKNQNDTTINCDANSQKIYKIKPISIAQINKNLNKSKEQKKLIIFSFHKKRFQSNKILNKSN